MPKTGGGAASLQEMLGVVPAPPARVWVWLQDSFPQYVPVARKADTPAIMLPLCSVWI